MDSITVHNFFNKTLTNEDYLNYSSLTNKISKFFISKDPKNTTLIASIVKSIRLAFGEQIRKFYDQSMQNFKLFGINITKIAFFLSIEANIIDYSSSLIIIEDIFETYPIEILEEVFNILEANLKIKPKFEKKEEQQNGLILLRIANSVLKRLSSNGDTQFRGKVQMALASVFKTDDKSGVNLKGHYNTNNGNSYNLEEKCLKSDVNYKFYKQFWVLHKYLTNPYLLFNSTKIEEDNEFEGICDSKIEEGSLSASEQLNSQDDKSQKRLSIFLHNINKILAYFANNKVANENSETILSYPKYLTKQDLFDLQLQDSSFRKTILTQFYIVLKSFLKPILMQQKRLFVFNENQKSLINDVLNSIKNQLSEFKSKNSNFFHKISKVFDYEETWENWKDQNCFAYESNPSIEITNQINSITKELDDSNNGKFEPDQVKSLFPLTESEKNATFNFNKDLLKYLDGNFNDLQRYFSEKSKIDGPSSTFIGYFLEKVYKDNDPEEMIEEEYKSKNQPVRK